MPGTRAWRYAAAGAGLSALLAAATLWTGFVDASDDPTISAVLYNREVVRILDRKCSGCHTRDAQAMPLDSYREVAPWSRAIREEILEHRMPPWPAAAGIRPLANDPSLTTREVALLLAWVDGGLPRGDPADLPAPRQPAEWKRGRPDQILTLPAQSLATDGATVVRRVRVVPAATGDRWLRGFDVAPGDRSALRAVFLSLEGTSGAPQWVGAWTPWYATTTPADVAFPLPARAALTVDLHYNAWADPVRTTTDASRIGLYADASAPRAVLKPLRIITAPGPGTAGRRRLTGEVAISEDAFVWALRPRLHRAETAVDGALEIVASRPDGSVEPLLWLKENGPDWQYAYELSDPVDLPRGSRIRLVAHPVDPAAAGVVADVDVAWFAGPAGPRPGETASAVASLAAGPRR